jgi:hypothetical protein
MHWPQSPPAVFNNLSFLDKQPTLVVSTNSAPHQYAERVVNQNLDRSIVVVMQCGDGTAIWQTGIEVKGRRGDGILWSSEDPAYDGSGFLNPDSDDGWRIQAESATVLAP